MSNFDVFLIFFQIVILGIFAYVLKLILKPNDPKSGFMTVQYCNEKMRDMEERFCNKIDELKYDIQKEMDKLHSKIDSLIIRSVQDK